MSTIAAIGTPHGKGGVAMIRISGAQAFEVAEKIFIPASRQRFSQRIHGKAEPNGFMELNICPEGFEFTLCALNDSHPLDGRKEVLPQKKI